jgi:predicted dehydrogenase
VTEALRTEAIHFLRCVEQNEIPLTDGRAGLQIVQILEAATRSMHEKGQPVELSCFPRQSTR